MMNRFWTQTVGAIVAVVALAAVNPTQAGFITTLPSWDGVQGVNSFGEPDTATYGQTITVGATETFLTDFSFRVATDVGNISRFEAIVMEWDSVAKVAVGPILFNSGLLTNSTIGDTPYYNVVGVTTNVQLVANKEYVLFFTTSNVFDTSNDFATFGSVSPILPLPDAYTGGSFVFNNNGNNFGSLSDPTNPWNVGYPNADDLAFTANLIDPPVNATPAPAGVVLFGLGFAGLGMFRSFRKSKVVA
jgi:hypothetical protein